MTYVNKSDESKILSVMDKFIVGEAKHQAPIYPNFDLLLRVYGSAKGPFYIVQEQTTDVQEELNLLIKTFLEVIHSQKLLLDYNGYYISYLLDQFSEEEFSEISEKFCYTPRYIQPEILSKKFRILFESTGLSFSAHDLTNLFKCSEEAVQSAMDILSSKGFITPTKNDSL